MPSGSLPGIMLPSLGGYVYLAMRQPFQRISLLISLPLLCSWARSPRSRLAQQSTQIIPVDQVHAGMQGYAYTIFAGDQIEKFDLEVLGVMPNFLGPKQSIILVELKGPKVEHTGVVAGMSGSPVYLDGKLAGALSLKLGIFTKEAIAGVTPIEDVLRPPYRSAPSPKPHSQHLNCPRMLWRVTHLPSGSSLQPIETPLVFSGFQPRPSNNSPGNYKATVLVATQGGAAADQKDDPHAHLAPGEMAGMVLVRGDVSINSACTVTAVQGDQRLPLRPSFHEPWRHPACPWLAARS